jgi:hypothetical protein
MNLDKLKLTDGVLDTLGFSEYHDSSGDFGTRQLNFSNGQILRIVDLDEKEDDSDGYWYGGKYQAQHFYFSDTFAIPKNHGQYFDLYFLDDLFNCVKTNYPDSIDEFKELCEAKLMSSYLPH